MHRRTVAIVSVLPAVHDHYVKFYDGEHDLVDGVGPFLFEGLRHGEMAVVIATEQHRRLFAEYLCDAGLPIDSLEDDGLYVSLDAAAVLRSFMIDGMPERDKFRDAVVPFVLAASAKHRPLRAFGEMVGILWKAGNVRGAVRLEELWNEVVDSYGFTLYCAYSAPMIAETRDLRATAAMCHTHSNVIPPAHYAKNYDVDSPADQVTKSFLPTPESLAAARWFVLSTLQAWDHNASSVGAVSVATAHLVTQVLHNNLQPFRITLRRGIHSVRVEVEHPADEADAADDAQASAVQADLVHRLAKEWGAATTTDTKVVWATFAA